jgi:uncharacterized protein (TIGR03086 family)
MSNVQRGRLDLLGRLLSTTRELVADVTPDDRTRPTPCTELDVEALLAHLIGWQQVFAACLRSMPAPFAEGSPTYRPSEDLAGDLHDASVGLLDALAGAPGEVELPYRGRTLVEVLVTELIAETALHTWDAATALDRTLAFDDRTVAAAHEGLTLLLGESFASQGFRPMTVADDAPADFETLLRRSGRDPARGLTAPPRD